jgi:small GTP-binding protein
VIKKVVLLGDSGVGKTSLVRRFVIDEFSDKYIATIGAKVTKKNIDYKLPSRTIYLTMMIWDILGQREFRKMRSTGIRDSSGIILVADLTNQESILGLVEFWYPQVQKTEGDVPAIIIGNKCDLLPPDAPAMNQVASIADEISSPYFFCSAKTGSNIESAFKSIGEIVISRALDFETSEKTEEKISMTEALDSIFADFCEHADDVSKCMEALDKLAAQAGLNINNPTKESSLEVIELMADSEKDRLGREIAEVNKLRRWKVLEGATTPK